MAAIHDMTIPMLPNQYYHIYNRGIAKQPIFFNDDNYRYFMQKFGEKTQGYFKTYGYCLLENHFHLLVRPHDVDIILSKAREDFETINQSFLKDYVLPWLSRMGHDVGSLTMKQLEDLTNFKNLLNLYDQLGDSQSCPDPYPPDISKSSFLKQICSWILSERLRGFMLGYAKAINKQQTRTGSLFQKGFRRKYVPDEAHDKKLVLCYIHHNPIHHFYTDSYSDFLWSSYNTYISASETKVAREEALSWFGGVEEFKKFSEYYKSLKKSFDWIIDED